MWLVKDTLGRELLLPRECLISGNMLVFKDWQLPVKGNLQALDPEVIEVIRTSVPGALWVTLSKVE